ncbi:hypothetical protein BROUX41_003792 [Berkeleyomyces rouxiae]|uniref:uncharacterized protein n=1 Tax=Berkeleyomyces rouxiae TaxID=2035830 RepID=UPI003B76D4D8
MTEPHWLYKSPPTPTADSPPPTNPAPRPKNIMTLADVHRRWPASPIPVFVYGSLMDPEIAQMAAALASPPALLPASIYGFQARMWKVFPSAICYTPARPETPHTDTQPNSAHSGAGVSPDPAGLPVLRGRYFLAPSFATIEKLCAYEGPTYTVAQCTITPAQDCSNGREPDAARATPPPSPSSATKPLTGIVFVAAHNVPVSYGEFDLARWQRESKKATMERLVNELGAHAPPPSRQQAQLDLQSELVSEK